MALNMLMYWNLAQVKNAAEIISFLNLPLLWLPEKQPGVLSYHSLCRFLSFETYFDVLPSFK